MSQRWPASTHLKIHDGCGGPVRWIEAWDTPGVQYTGECLECGYDSVSVEDILPFELPADMSAPEAYDQLDIEELRRFEWPQDPSVWDEKQAEFREMIET